MATYKDIMFRIMILISMVFLSNILANPQTAKFGSKIFYKCDYNKDGFLNQEEYLNMSTKRFKRMDLNKNNQIIIDELKNTKLALIMPKIAISWFKRSDLNNDTIVTIKEITIISNKKFKMMDTDNDKLLNFNEWQSNNPSFNK